MNIFILDNDHRKNIEFYCDKHIVKQTLEYVQLLSTAIYCNWPNQISSDEFKEQTHLYRPTHINHPISKWVRKTQSNFKYLELLTNYIFEEYHYRYNKIHKSLECFCGILDKYIELIPSGSLTSFEQCMPEQYRVKDNAVLAYRRYYINEKKHLLKYTKRQYPEWLKNIS